MHGPKTLTSELTGVQLTLTDRSVEVTRDSSSALGQGCRLGFLGSLHMDVFRQRLEDEYNANVIITAPTVPYKGMSLGVFAPVQELIRRAVIWRDGKETFISNPTDFPEMSEIGYKVLEVQEPVVKASIIVPQGPSASIIAACPVAHRAER